MGKSAAARCDAGYVTPLCVLGCKNWWALTTLTWWATWLKRAFTQRQWYKIIKAAHRELFPGTEGYVKVEPLDLSQRPVQSPERLPLIAMVLDQAVDWRGGWQREENVLCACVCVSLIIDGTCDCYMGGGLHVWRVCLSVGAWWALSLAVWLLVLWDTLLSAACCAVPFCHAAV